MCSCHLLVDIVTEMGCTSWLQVSYIRCLGNPKLMAARDAEPSAHSNSGTVAGVPPPVRLQRAELPQSRAEPGQTGNTEGGRTGVQWGGARDTVKAAGGSSQVYKNENRDQDRINLESPLERRMNALMRRLPKPQGSSMVCVNCDGVALQCMFWVLLYSNIESYFTHKYFVGECVVLLLAWIPRTCAMQPAQSELDQFMFILMCAVSRVNVVNVLDRNGCYVAQPSEPCGVPF